MDYRTWRHQLIQEAAKQRIPILGEFELTARCNLACEMCYVKDTASNKEKTSQEWKELFFECAKQGMMFALLTGGEILMRKDFIELYEYLFDLGVRITLFTNGTLMTQEVIDAFVKRKPDFIAITLYGSNNQTYQQITKNHKGFDMVHQSIQLLKNNNIPVMLRTIPIRPIVDEMDELISYAKHQELPLGYALYVGPTRDLCHKELGLRLKPLELIEFERKMRVNYGLEPEPDFLESSSNTTCAALKSGFYIDYRFHMMPCAMLNHPKKIVSPQTFIQTFHELGDIFTSLNHCNDCSTCDSKSSCIQCYARRFLEGDAHTCHPYLKAIAKLRKGDHHETN